MSFDETVNLTAVGFLCDTYMIQYFFVNVSQILRGIGMTKGHHGEKV